MYIIKYLEPKGWTSLVPHATIESAEADYEEYIKYYHYVQIVQVETVTSTVVIKESASE